MKRLDYAVPLGLCLGLAAILAGAWLEEISLRFLWQPAAALVVFGGTLGALVVRQGAGGVVSGFRACVALCRREDPYELDALLARLLWLARAAHRDGVRIYENAVATYADPLVKQALRLAADRTDPNVARTIIDRILDDEDRDGACHAATLEAAGGYAPTFGILGAVLGLVHVLRSLAEPSALGFGIATAFVATIYGVGVANLLLLPLAARLRARHAARMRDREVLADILIRLAAHESPVQMAQTFSAATRNPFSATPIAKAVAAATPHAVTSL